MPDRVLIAGTHSGCGKTTVTCALLAALKRRGLAVSAFKCGPDYIDPMFHREAIGVPSRNLDPFFCTGEQLCAALARQTGDLSMIEGVMGYYDGVGTKGALSTFGVARETNTPVILVVDCRGMYASAGAMLQGFCTFRPDSHIRGVIWNGASPALYKGLCQIAHDAGVTPLGFLPREGGLTVGSRRLGLLTAGEIADIGGKLDRLAALAEECIDLDGVRNLAKTASPLSARGGIPASATRVRIAVARDAAFCFLYQENLELLTQFGGELLFFSPLADSTPPRNIGGLYLPGGYPELHPVALSANESMKQAIHAAIAGGLPTIAECGGFLYLHNTLDGFPMTGAISAAAHKTERLQRFGYVTLTAKRDNLLCRQGESIRAHSFHYYDSANTGCDFTAAKPLSGCRWDCIHATDTLYAGFPHLYFPANPAMVDRFVRKAAQYAPADYA